MNAHAADHPTFTTDQLEHLPDAAFLADLDGRIAGWNAAAAALLGHPPEEAMGARCDRLLEGVSQHGTPVCVYPCPFVRGVLPTRRESRSGGRARSHPDLLARHADGGRLNLSVRGITVSIDGVPMLLHLIREQGQLESEGSSDAKGRWLREDIR